MSRELLSVAAVASRLGVSEKTVRRRIAARALPAFRDGGVLRVRPRDLDRYVARHTVTAIEPRDARASAPPKAPAPPGPVRRLWDHADPLSPGEDAS